MENIFVEYDKFAKWGIFLYNHEFGMDVNNPKEAFEDFFARITSAIMPVNFTDCHKTCNL